MKEKNIELSTSYTIKVENFEGPFDLLFHLIEKNRMDIYDIQIAEITDQYINYLKKMEELDLEVTSEFLVMASTLLLIKSRMLLPEAGKGEEEPEDLKDDLVNRLIEYKRYKEFTAELRDREAYFSRIFYKPHEIFRIEPAKVVNASYSPELIPAIYESIYDKNRRKMNPESSPFKEIMARDKITVRSKIREVVRKLITRARFKFSELFTGGKNTRLDVATAFMALLELTKVRRITLEQKKSFGEIVVKKRGKG